MHTPTSLVSRESRAIYEIFDNLPDARVDETIDQCDLWQSVWRDPRLRTMFTVTQYHFVTSDHTFKVIS